ncbi:MAG TPA: serine protease [Fimbriimonas sp.]|nr:serine protease [Fimbriimonas sp.]
MLLALILAAQDPTFTAVELFHRCSPSIVTVIGSATDSTGTAISQGSAFYVGRDKDGRDLYATCYHVVKGMSPIALEDGAGGNLGTAKVWKEDDAHDLALIWLQKPREGIEPLVVPESSEALFLPGDRIYAIGTPRGVENIISEGIVGGFERQNGLLPVSLPLSHGSSGCPIIATDGSVVGMADSTAENAQLVNFIEPAHTVASIIDDDTKAYAREHSSLWKEVQSAIKKKVDDIKKGSGNR